MNRSITILFILLMLAGCKSDDKDNKAHKAAATPTPIPVPLDAWRVESYQSLLSDDFPVQRSFPAPDGKQIGYEKDDGVFCAINKVSSEERCVTIPRELSRMSAEPWFSSLAWSPDSERIALVGSPYRYMRDTDLTAITLSTGETHILAQDIYRYDLINSHDLMRNPIFIDVSPAWSPDGKVIAVERTMLTKDDSFGATNITLVDSISGHPSKLADIPGHVAGERDMGTTLTMVWSPDGSTLAAGFRHVDFNPAVDGIWLVDVKSGAPTQLVTVSGAENALHEILPEAEAFAAVPLSWSPDGSRLLFSVGNPGSLPGQIWCFWIDLASKQITALPLPTHPEDRPDRRMINPRSVVWSPDGSTLLVAAWENEPLPGEDQHVIDPSGENARVGLRLVNVATGDSVLLGHLPTTSMGIYQGSWGPDNDVIINGYYLKLAHP